MISSISIIIGALLFISFFFFAISSLYEKEKRAFRIALLIGIILPLPYLAAGLLDFPEKQTIGLILIIITVVIALIILFPVNFFFPDDYRTPSVRIDERDIMFSRMRLMEGTDRFNDYYKNRPKNRAPDDHFRTKPGLLNEKSHYYEPLTFSSANASFYTVHSFSELVNGDVANKQLEVDSRQISNYIKQWSKRLGAVDVGITILKDYHLYSRGGRERNYGQPIEKQHGYAIAFTVEMRKDIMDYAPAGPTVMESAEQYLNSGSIAMQVAAFIRNLGYQARAHIDGNYHVLCPLVARDAGLGEIGRMGLLMTPKLGPRVRISVVTTSIPLIPDVVKTDFSVIDFCNHCKKCAEVCPSHAIPVENRINIDGVNRWQINSEACFTYWCISGTDCGKCVVTCPFAHENILLHRLIRAATRYSFIFRRLAIKLDNVFYGRRPKAKQVLDWLPKHEK